MVTADKNNSINNILKIKKMNTRSKIAVFGMVALSFAFSGNAAAQQMKEKTVMVGGAAMYPSKNIVENAVNSKDHKTLVAAVKAAGLVETLQSEGPFTVFAPTDAAFAKLPAGTVENLVKPENKAMLTKILTYHVLPGKYSAKQVWAAVKAGNGKAMMKTVQGEELTFWTKGKNLYVTDAKGNKAKVTIADVNQSNGVIHVIDTVLMP
ncbi:Uncaracterized surface protein containing fasciclin (FAS1) repeats [Chryseobacterium indoltheticum]|uniref:Immunogenic protein MPT70 n=2 Tax=Chryseobacterium indoltheticum TaxID=254 RepID=A0A381JT10_9FLAO|nr:Uncaracterized surface protein containing fasciclin (FAS1) repeats [Chryseobacterium indoltheticum]SUY53674.1 Immunogenic protein MPT70 precursor [Chryseobacterium indoltheticum]